MRGGDFYANLNGLEHYKEFGYKGLLKPGSSVTDDVESSGDWVRIKYRSNRGILHDGDFPHFSSPVAHIAPDTRRVILGFNFFSDAVGECSTRAPEVAARQIETHSYAMTSCLLFCFDFVAFRRIQ